MSHNRGTLYLVATPIGNLEDVTRRALRVLSEADVVACEDTRRTRSLLEHFGLRARTVSYHEHNERERAEELARLIEEGQTVAIRFEDTGGGVELPERLFHPFQPGAAAAGLGLYVSRAIVRSFDGDLLYEPRPGGSRFTIVLATAQVPAGVDA